MPGVPYYRLLVAQVIRRHVAVDGCVSATNITPSMHGNTFRLPIHFNMIGVVHDIYLVPDEPERNAVSVAVFTQPGMITGRDLNGATGSRVKIAELVTGKIKLEFLTCLVLKVHYGVGFSYGTKIISGI